MQDRASKTKGLIWLAAAVLLGGLCASGLSPLAHAIPWRMEKELGDALAPTLPSISCHNQGQADLLLQRLVMRLYPIRPGDDAFSIEVKLVESPEINAYATLGGHIYINSGLLAKAGSPEELAGILAHEIEHVHHRHIMEATLMHLFTIGGLQMVFGDSSSAEWAKYFLNLDFTRSQEKQADQEGLRRLQKAHIDNQGFRHFFERMEKTESAAAFLSDHPSSESRHEMTEKFSNQDIKPIMTEGEWLVLKDYCHRE